ncbi:glucose-6-phosphate isomerase [Bacillaceae bacterium W0354]
MMHIKLKSELLNLVTEDDLRGMVERVKKAHCNLHNGTGKGNDFIGWVDWPAVISENEVRKVEVVAERIRDQSDVVLVIGVGGSYLGARAAIEMLSHTFLQKKEGAPDVYFVGHHLSATYMTELKDVIQDKDISIIFISKSGTTTEPAIAFRVFRDMVEEKYGKDEASRRIYAITDQSKGTLRQMADEYGYTSFVIPDDIGGRYSVLTPVGLLPIAAAGIDIQLMINGARQAMEDLLLIDVMENPAYRYAAARNILLEKGKKIELLVSFEPKLSYFAEWWKQLFGESEGKEGKGIFPASANFTTDLHSLGQYIQAGPRHLIETFVKVNEIDQDIRMKDNYDVDDGLDYLNGMSIHEINEKALEGTRQAHSEGGVPNFVIEIPRIDAFTVGYLFYFFMKACAISGYLLDVNPFDQPDVEKYKRNMFELLGKTQRN